MSDVAAILLGWILLHGLLRWLWPERTLHGLLLIADDSGTTDVSSIIILPWLVLFAVGMALRLRETHPEFFAGLGWTSVAPVRSGSRILAFYATASLAGIVVDHAFDFHFVTSIGIYVIVATLLAGCTFAGRRRPFLDVSISRPPGAAKRRRADVVSAVLLAAMYAEFMVDRPFWHLQDDIPPWIWAVMQTAFAVLGAVLGWALLHGSLARLPRWFVRWIGSAAGSPPEQRRPALDTIAHVVAASVVLVALRSLFTLWTSDLWFLPREDGSTVFLGVDWYFVTAFESATAGEVFVLLGFGVVGSISRRW